MNTRERRDEKCSINGVSFFLLGVDDVPDVWWGSQAAQMVVGVVEAVEKSWSDGSPSTVDRSTGSRRPVDGRADGKLKGGNGEREREREMRSILGLNGKAKDPLRRQKLSYI